MSNLDMYKERFNKLPNWSKKNLVDRLFLNGKYKDKLNKIKENFTIKDLKDLKKITNKNYYYYENKEDILNIYIVELFYK